MSNKNEEQKPVRLLELERDYAIWRVPLSALREQDKNARVMAGEKFDRLADNIKRDGMLESLPLCVLDEKGESPIFHVISGHHRTRAARKAGVHNLIILVIEREMTRDEIISKQLSHNSLEGYDDPQILKELYDEIKIIDFKISSGVTDFELDIEHTSLKIDDVKIVLDYETINILFLPRQVEHLEKVVAEIKDEATVYLADKKDFERMAEQIRTIAKRDNIVNMSAIIARMIEIVETYHKNVPPPEKDDKKKTKKK